jgi:S-adenosylmethionine synthetase
MTIESATGKTPVNHVDKLYNIVSNLIAMAIVNICHCEQGPLAGITEVSF